MDLLLDTTVADRVLVDTVGPDEAGVLYLLLVTVDADHRGEGLGTAALAALCEHADAAGWTIRLHATSDLGSDAVRLVRWYLRAGFVPDPATEAMWPSMVPMIRRPIC